MENKNYNLNSKYGRKKAREQAQRNYQNGTPEYKKDIDNMTAIFWVVVIVIGLIIFIIKSVNF